MKISTLCVLSFLFILISLRDKPYKKILKKTDFVFIPSGEINDTSYSTSISAFLMLNHEVTNFEYSEFIHDKYLSINDTVGAKLALPDTSAWKSSILKSYYGESLAVYYYRHPAYRNYPVVNISKEDAISYCKWLTSKMQELYPEHHFGNFRLPSKQEWIYAAKGGLKNNPYPWGGPYTRNAKGVYLANYNIVGEHNLKANENGKPEIVDHPKYKVEFLKDIVFGPATTKSYFKNDFGLYNMAGNVAELVADENVAMGGHWKSYGNDIQITSQINFEGSNPFVGFRPVMSVLDSGN